MSKTTGRKPLRILVLLGIIALVAYLISRSSNQESGDRPQYQVSLLERILIWKAELINKFIPWHRLPYPLGVVNLIGIRDRLRLSNLHDTQTLQTADQPPPDPRYVTSRTAKGDYNDLKYPAMGEAGARFARNIPLQYAYPEPEPGILSPSPRTISRELLTRHSFQPVTILNLLAGAWIQFQVHDWFNHGPNEEEGPWEIPLKDGDPWPQDARPMTVDRTRRDPTRTPPDSNLPPTYTNTQVHWWDGSQIYGSSQELMTRLRSGVDGRLVIGSDGLLPVDPDTGIDITGFNDNWWVGLSLLHTLFTLEHNAICDRLKDDYTNWSDDDLFHHARLINAALMAKIHTLEWTPAILAHPAVQFGMRGNWWGLLGEQFYGRFGRIINSDIISGIMGSSTDHHSGIYAMTEEFNAVYRMHPLMPDDVSFRSLANDELLQDRPFMEIAFREARNRLEEMPMADVIYSFGISHPGAITLHNFPRFLQQFQPPDGKLIDLGAVDILRDRERGVPRYNQFRQLLHMPRINSFEEMTNNPEWTEELKYVYDNDVDRVDAMVGMYAEPFPQGFGFSDTAFRIFVLMASRRLKSDRFFTTHYTPEVYTPAGMQWINDNTMLTVLLRHFPGLYPVLRDVDNAFKPWPRACS